MSLQTLNHCTMKRTLEKPNLMLPHFNSNQTGNSRNILNPKKFRFQNGLQQILFTILILAISLQVNGTVYYVSNSGNDSNSGTSESQAWKSIAKVNSFVPKAGDQILFKSGDSWSGSLNISASGVSGSPIVYGSFGTGAKPKIYGSEIISGWTLHSGNIYKASFNQTINQLFLNDSKVMYARYPNSGYASINTVNSSSSFTCNALNGSINYAGAVWIARTTPFSTETANVTASSGNTLTLSRVPFPDVNTATGFILVGKLALLDTPGEWYYDATTKTVFVWTPAGDSPNNYTVRGSVYDNGVSISNKNYITIKNLDIQQHKSNGILVSGSNITIDNNNIVYPEAKGIHITYGSSMTIINNNVREAVHVGIYSFSSNSTYSDNTISEISMFKSYGSTGIGAWYMGNGLYVEGNDNVIRYNRVTNIGAGGIQFHKRNLVEYNYVSNVLMVKDDGGGIYTSALASYPNSPVAGSVVRYNIVDGAYGSLVGCNPYGISQGHGIYLDENSGGVTVENNTVTNCTFSGIYLHNSYNETIRNNTSYNNGRQFHVNNDLGGSQITGNIFYGLLRNIENYANQSLGSKRSANSMVLNNNTYINHQNSSGIFKLDDTKSYDFAGWKTATGQDLNSTIDVAPLATGEKEVLFYNDSKTSKAISLGTSVYKDINGKQFTGSVTLEPFTSKILIKTTSTVSTDNIAPTISTFSVPATSTELTVPVTSFVATDNAGVTGYKLSESSSIPGINDAGWMVNAPVSYTFASEGVKTLYAWAKDASGNISASISKQITISMVKSTPIVATTSYSEYRFEEPAGISVNDVAGINNGTIVNTVLRSSGSSGNGLQFTGAGYVNLGKCFGDNVTNQVSMSAWIKPEATGSWVGIITHGSPSLDNYALYINPDLKKVVFRTRNTEPVGSTWTEVSATSLWDGNWHLITVTYDGSQKIIFIDGVAIATVSATGNIESGSGYDLVVGGGREYAWGGTLYKGLMDQVGIYNYALTNSQVQDLFKKVTPVPKTVYSTENVSICQGDSYNGWTTAGQYQKVLVSTLGADSIVITNLTVNPTYEIAETVTINEGNSYWGFSEPGVYERKLTTVFGCDSIITTTLAVNMTVFTTLDISIKEGENYKGWTESGQYVENLKAATGADSILTINLTVLQKLYGTETIEICDGESYLGWNTSGQFERNLIAAEGNDSIVTTFLTVRPKSYGTESITINEGENYLGWKTSGTYTKTLAASNGCDSIVTINLTVNPKLYTTENISICQKDSYLGWTASGQYSRNLTAITGADSIVTTVLTVNPIKYATEKISIYEGESYKGYTQSATFATVLASAAGCDSIVTTILTVTPKVINSIEYVEICEGESYEGWSESGQYIRSLSSANNLDSTVTTVLTVNPLSFITEEVTIKEGEQHKGYTKSSNFSEVFSTIHGCDSIVTTVLTVLPTIRTEEYITVNEGEVYNGWSMPGEYQRTLAAANGADSIVTTFLEVIYIARSTESITICEGDSYEGWTVSGKYERLLKTVNGTDSIAVTNLIVNPIKYSTENISISEGQNYLGWTENGQYTRTLVSVTGCDSIVTTILSVEPLVFSQIISLNKGWNYFSSKVVPANTDMEIVLTSLINNGSLLEVQDESSNTLTRKSAKHGWVNNIGSLKQTEGYKIRLNSDTELEIIGKQVQRPLNIEIKSGINLISFPYNGSVDAIKVIKPLIDAGILDKVQDEKGNSIEFWGSSVGWVNGIGNFKEGEAYLVLAKNNGNLPIFDSYEKSEIVLANSEEPNFFRTNFAGNGSRHMNINIVGLNKSNIQTGDEIATFDGNICTGVVKINQLHLDNDVVSLNASVSDLDLVNGFTEGNSIQIRRWNSATNQTTNSQLEITAGEMVYQCHASVFGQLKSQTVTGIDNFENFNIDVYPNPATERLTVSFQTLPETGAKIIMRDLTGKELLAQNVYSNREVLNIQNLPSGIYLVSVSGSNDVKKIVKK